jgi:glycosyltransferase involved in cell wall biosynthesis
MCIENSSIRDESLAVAMVCFGYPPDSIGGAEIQCQRLSVNLAKHGVKVLVLTPAIPGRSFRTRIDGVDIIRPDSFFNPMKRVKNSLKRLFEKKDGSCGDSQQFDSPKPKSVVKALREFFSNLPFFLSCFLFLLFAGRRYKIIHVHNLSNYFGFVFSIIGKIFRRKVIIKDSTMNGINQLEKYPLGRWMQKVILKSASIIAVSRYIYDNFKSLGFPEHRIFKIPNGIELPELPAEKKQFGRHCLFVGNLHRPIKGFPTLLKAWKTVIEQFPDARLTVVGGGVGDELLKDVQEMGILTRIEFVGRSENVRDYLRRSDIFVLPSKREGMSNALIEAMAYGLACIATDISGNQDLIENGKNGILIPVDDAEKLAEGIINLLKNPDTVQHMGILARETIERRCSFNVIIPQYLKIYRETAWPKAK